MNVQVIDAFRAAEDPQMPLPARALDPVEVQHVFQRRLSALANGEGPLRVCAIRVTRYKPGRRCLVEYDLASPRRSSARTGLTLLGKMRAGKLKRSAYCCQMALYNNGFDENAPDGVSVPQPVALIPELQMWLQRKIPGKTATQCLRGAGGIALARRIAEAVHKLHQAGVSANRRHTMADELRILHERLPVVARRKPQWDHRIREVLAACDQLGAGVAEPAGRPIHRDFYPDQVLVSGARLYLVDFDLYCLGDPGLDIGNFVGHLIEQSARRDPGGRGQLLQVEVLRSQRAGPV